MRSDKKAEPTKEEEDAEIAKVKKAKKEKKEKKEKPVKEKKVSKASAKRVEEGELLEELADLEDDEERRKLIKKRHPRMTAKKVAQLLDDVREAVAEVEAEQGQRYERKKFEEPVAKKNMAMKPKKSAKAEPVASVFPELKPIHLSYKLQDEEPVIRRDARQESMLSQVEAKKKQKTLKGPAKKAKKAEKEENVKKEPKKALKKKEPEPEPESESDIEVMVGPTEARKKAHELYKKAIEKFDKEDLKQLVKAVDEYLAETKGMSKEEALKDLSSMFAPKLKVIYEASDKEGNVNKDFLLKLLDERVAGLRKALEMKKEEASDKENTVQERARAESEVKEIENKLIGLSLAKRKLQKQ